jgi:nucleoside-diphosphate-sugar epimerase
VKILLTGSSSFTGLWFARELVARGHELTLTFRQGRDAYEGIRGQRVALLERLGRCVFGTCFGDTNFLKILDEDWDLLALHGAEASNHRSPDFDVGAAVASNVQRAGEVFKRGFPRTIVTGSVFEGGEGAGCNELPDIYPYGLSKRLSSEVLRFYARTFGVRFQKFVIPNTFGPFEEARFTSYVIGSWLRGLVPECRTPGWVRDNVPVQLLAMAYAWCCEQGPDHFGPSGYVETMSDFVLRLARELSPRLGIACPFTCSRAPAIGQPAVRINVDACDFLPWSESRWWDELAAFYRSSI